MKKSAANNLSLFLFVFLDKKNKKKEIKNNCDKRVLFVKFYQMAFMYFLLLFGFK